jgi:hypothetical protein
VKVPSEVSKAVAQIVWAEASQLDWPHMSPQSKARQYEDWASREDVGGVLARHMDSREVRVYVKDTLMKTYSRQTLASHERPFRVLGLGSEAETAESYVKPHGRRIVDGRILCWGPASNWKAVVVSVYERSGAEDGLVPFGAVLTRATGRFRDDRFRKLVEDVATRLGIERVIWLDQ